MLVPLSWLKDYVNVTQSPIELAQKLTMAGVEVGGVEEIGSNWDRDKILVGCVVSVDAHPNADRLRLPTLDLGGGVTATVVCGAPNVAVGQKIAFAKEGAMVFSPRSGKVEELKPAKIRGVVSSGMVCSVLELGIGDEHEGILVLDHDAPIGTALADYLGDAILDAEVTPNRPDCLSILGIAHEVAALTNQQTIEPDISYEETGPNIESQINIHIDDPDLCYRYTASLVSGVKIGPSPLWMQQALIKSGQRPINNIVDITNYVMQEYGQPLHAFDFDKVKDRSIIVRKASDGEHFVTLDGEIRRLSSPMLAIADSQDVIGLAGIMGGANSEMTTKTTSVLLEAATFNPVNTRSTRIALDMNTEASYRFERGIRASLAPIALRRATKLILELCGGEAAKGIIDLYPTDQEPPIIQISRNRVRQVLGVDYTISTIENTLISLGFEKVERPEGLIDPVEAIEATTAVETHDNIWMKVPYWRSDITIEDDLVEEIARTIGYDSIPTLLLSTQIPHWTPQPMTALKDRVKDLLVSAGMQETISYSPTTLENLSKVGALDDSNPPLRIANPQSAEWEYMRTTLRSSLLNTLGANRRVSRGDGIRIFEVGRIYLPSRNPDPHTLPSEVEMLIGAVSGPRTNESWATQSENMGFFDAKGALEHLFTQLGVKVKFQRSSDSILHPGRTACITAGDATLGVIGEVTVDISNHFATGAFPVAMFEISLDALLRTISNVKLSYQPTSRFPESYRDLALIVDSEVSSDSIEAIINRHGLVSGSIPFDIYDGEGVPEGKKSIAYRVVFQSVKGTLTSEEIDRFQGDIIRQLRRQLNAELRS